MTKDISIPLPSLDLTIKAISYGNPDKPLILALHGWLDNAGSFALLAPLLKDYHVIAIDLPGHGFTQWPATQTELHIQMFVDMLLTLINRLSDEPIILLGHSLGGAISTVFAAQHPDKVAKLILIDVLGPLSADILADNPTLQTNIKTMQQAALYAAEKVYPSKEAMIHIRMKANHLTHSQAQPIVDRGIQQTDKGLQWRFDKMVAKSSAFYFVEQQVLTILSNIQCPVLIIAGTEGIFKGRDFYNQRLQQLSNAKLIFIDGYHHVHLEQPNACATNIIHFLSH